MKKINWPEFLNNSRAILAILHLLVGVASFIRPNMTELVLGYRDFNAIGPTSTWGTAALVIGTGMAFISDRNPFLVIWQTGSAAFFTLFCILVTTGPAEFNYGTIVYGGLAVWSAALGIVTVDGWLKNSRLRGAGHAYLVQRRDARNRGHP